MACPAYVSLMDTVHVIITGRAANILSWIPGWERVGVNAAAELLTKGGATCWLSWNKSKVMHS